MTGFAQQVLAPPPQEFSLPRPPIFPGAATNEGPSLLTEPAATAALPSSMLQRLFDAGQLQLRPHLLYRVTYGNGLQAAPGQRSNTLINEISSGLLVNIGSHWHFDYTPTLRYYSSGNFKDSTDHALNLTWGTSYHALSLGFSQGYSISSAPLAETASQTQQEAVSTSLSAAWQLNDRLSLDSSASQNFRLLGANADTNQLSDSRTWSITEGLNCFIGSGLSVGLSLGLTYDDITVGSDMLSEQFQGRINWGGQKLSASFTGGIEDRQFLDSRLPASITPIFNLTLGYRAFEQTTFTASANRTVTPSYFANQVSENLNFNLGVHQRLLGRLSLDVSGGYGTMDYKATTATLTASRLDKHTSIDVRLGCTFLTRGSISVFYDWSDNSSNEQGFQYTSNQVGLDFGYRF